MTIAMKYIYACDKCGKELQSDELLDTPFWIWHWLCFGKFWRKYIPNTVIFRGGGWTR
jgi:predicted nucleic acid-binding Zn ribbon protein